MRRLALVVASACASAAAEAPPLWALTAPGYGAGFFGAPAIPFGAWAQPLARNPADVPPFGAVESDASVAPALDLATAALASTASQQGAPAAAEPALRLQATDLLLAMEKETAEARAAMNESATHEAALRAQMERATRELKAAQAEARTQATRAQQALVDEAAEKHAEEAAAARMKRAEREVVRLGAEVKQSAQRASASAAAALEMRQAADKALAVGRAAERALGVAEASRQQTRRAAEQARQELAQAQRHVRRAEAQVKATKQEKEAEWTVLSNHTEQAG